MGYSRNQIGHSRGVRGYLPKAGLSDTLLENVETLPPIAFVLSCQVCTYECIPQVARYILYFHFKLVCNYLEGFR